MPHGFVDAADTKRHLRELRARGYGWDRISELTGIAVPSLVLKRDQINVDTARAILSIPMPDAPIDGGGYIPSLGTRRRIRALARIGYSQRAIAEMLGMDQRNLSTKTGGATVSSSLAKRVAELFNELQLTTGPSNNARVRAEKLGWPPPLAWDEETIDDPAAQPVGHRSTKTDRVELYKRWRDKGWTDAEIAARFGITASSMSRWRMRQEELGLIA